MSLRNEKISLGAILVIIGIGILYFYGSGFTLSLGNLVIGTLFVIIGVSVAVSKGTTTNPNNVVQNVTTSSNEKKVDGKQVSFEEETFTKKVTDKSTVAG